MALKAGRPEEAGKILQQDSVRDFLPAKQLSHEVAEQLVARAEKNFQHGDSVASWTDLQQASQLGGVDDRVAQLRQVQTEQGFQRVRQLLTQGETKLAAEQITRLEKHRLGGKQRQSWKLIIHLISRAKELADRGNVTGAVEMLQRATKLLDEPTGELAEMLAARQEKLQQQAAKLRQLSSQLHQQLSQEAWTDVLTTAEALLELAPSHTAARHARQQAWDAVGMKVTRVADYNRHINRLARSVRSTHAWVNSPEADTNTMQRDVGKRWIAWIDGVGGYMLCLGDEVMLGQPAGVGGADIPILADLSRRHASIRREGEAYVISPIHRVRVDGIELSGPQVLKDGALVELGDSVRLQFRKPHALSGTAILTLESHHKTDPAVDGIVLMSESCVLGPKPQSHIQCRKWTDDLVLFRRGEEIQFRTAATVEIDGEPNASAGVITANTRINSENFALSFEEA